MPFNVAPPWNPGFALPDNVKDEGLERHGYVTEMMPRNTRDQTAKVGTGGYAVPAYVIDEGLGRGTYTTAMAPRGTRPNVPHYMNRRPGKRHGPGGQITFAAGKAPVVGPTGMVALGDTSDPGTPEPALHPIFKQFGDRAATVILSRVSRLPVNKRESTLRKILSELDTSAWSRTQAIAKRYRAQGMHPSHAIPAALSRALGTGLAAEMIHKGHNSLRGQASTGKMMALGRATAMGDAPPPMGVLARLASTIGIKTAVSQPCLGNPPPGYTWDDSCNKNTGCFRPVGKGEPVVKKRGANVCVTPSMIQQNYKGVPVFSVGPFSIPLDAPNYAYMFMDASTIRQTMPKAWLSAIQLAFNPHAPGKDDPNPVTVQATGQPNDVSTWLTALGVQQPIDMNVLAGKAGFQGSWYDWIPQVGFVDAVYQGVSGSINNLTGPPEPFAKFTHPKTGDDWGAWLRIAAPNNTKVPAPTRLTIYFGKIPDGSWFNNLLTDIFNPIAEGADATATAAGEALSAIGDLVCSIASNPIIAQVGGAAAGAAIGGKPGAQAGAAGGAVANAACTQGPPAYVQPDSGWTMPLLIAGGIAVVALLATGKKKASP